MEYWLEYFPRYFLHKTVLMIFLKMILGAIGSCALVVQGLSSQTALVCLLNSSKPIRQYRDFSAA